MVQTPGNQYNVTFNFYLFYLFLIQYLLIHTQGGGYWKLLVEYEINKENSTIYETIITGNHK